jgi:hypothetical protein
MKKSIKNKPTRVLIDGNPITVIIQDIFTKDGDEFATFVDQDNNQRTLQSNLIEVSSYTMD